ncbi:MAG TPA: radical SAM protein, partial [Candidatus Lokiarchaeia archaeon]
MKKKVYVFQLQSASWKNLLPLSAALLVSYSKSISKLNKNYDFEIKIIREKPLETVKSLIYPNILAFSTYSWNFRQSLEIARLGKLRSSECFVIFGGPMIPTNPNDLRKFFEKYSFIDIAVQGMGEWAFSDILLSKLGEKKLNQIAGISYLDTDGSIVTNKPNYNKDVNEIPSPFLNGTFDEILSRYQDKITGALWETNRGCPYSCTFCVQGNLTFSKILKYDFDRLEKELDWISKNKISYLYGTDANFGILPRDIDIVKKIADHRKKNGYPEHFGINWLKNSSKKIMEIIETLNRGGVGARLTLSMQSFNEDTLKAVKRKNISFEKLKELKKEAARKGIITYTELILGLPEDSYDSILKSLDNCMDGCLTHFFIVYLGRLLDATEMSEDEYKNKYKLKTRTCKVGIGRHEGFNVGVDETEEIIVSTSALTVSDWTKIFDIIHVALTLYNFRLAFFIFNYLRAEYNIDIIDLIKFIIKKAIKNNSVPVIRNAIKIINNGRQAILDEKTNLVSLDFTGHILFEVHEAALFLILKELDSFYKEMRLLINDYLNSKSILFDESILDEVFKYQEYRIPTWNIIK